MNEADKSKIYLTEYEMLNKTHSFNHPNFEISKTYSQ